MRRSRSRWWWDSGTTIMSMGTMRAIMSGPSSIRSVPTGGPRSPLADTGPPGPAGGCCHGTRALAVIIGRVLDVGLFLFCDAELVGRLPKSLFRHHETCE